MPQRSTSSSSRRGWRLQAAQSMLVSTDFPDAGVGGGKEFDLMNDANGMRPQSQTDDPSSHLFQPKWRRLLRTVAAHLASRCEEVEGTGTSATAERLRATFTHGDAVGGGTEEDVAQCLTRFLEVMEMSDSNLGFTLLCAYQLLQAQDLPFCSQTWRPLLVTAVVVAMDCVCNNSKESQAAAVQIQKHVAHLWPQHKADEGRKVFKNRAMFRTVTRSEIVKLYFELRDSGLRKEPGDEADSTSIAAVLLAEIGGPPPARGSRTLGLQDQRNQQRARPRGRGGPTPDEDSLGLSDSLSIGFSENKIAGAGGSKLKDLVSL